MPNSWTANQLVAHNLREARQRRNHTQKEAAALLAPYLGGKPWSVASFSAAESTARNGARTREFSANEILAFSQAFDLPVSYFFTPPIGEPTYRPVTCGGDSIGVEELLKSVSRVDETRVAVHVEALPKAARALFAGHARVNAYARLGQPAIRNVTEHAADLRRLANELESFDDRVQDELKLALEGKED